MTEPAPPSTLPHVSFDPSSRRFTADQGPELISLPPLGGQVVLDDDVVAAASDDYGHLVHRRPLAVLQPSSTSDLAAFSRFASEHSIPLVPRGQGHSTGGQAQTSDGVVVDMTPLNRVHQVNADSIVVEAGARWSQVLAATIPHGLTPPVLTDYLELSVGGTLSVGGIGGTSHRYGAQTDNVLSLDVVTPDGNEHTCLPGSDLASAVLAGRGRYGVIVRATLRLVPAPQRTRTYRLRYTDLADFLADQRKIMTDRRADHLVGQAKLDPVHGWAYVVDATTYTVPPSKLDAQVLLAGLKNQQPEEQLDRDYAAFLNQMADDVALLERLGAWTYSHPWLNLIISDDSVEEFVTTTLATTTRQGLGDVGVVLLYPTSTRAFTTPQLRVPNSSSVFLFAVLRSAPQDDHDVLRKMINDNEELIRLAVAAGSVSYLGEL